MEGGGLVSVNLDKATWTYGCELELSDVPRIALPSELGSWDGCERDVVNTKAPYHGVAADPLGFTPPVGGEINTPPTLGWPMQVDHIAKVFGFFRAIDAEPVAGPTSHLHIHVCVPGLVNDIDALKRLACYVFDNQEDMIRICGRYTWKHDMGRKAQDYFKQDGGRMLPAYILNNILDKATTFDQFIKMHAAGKDGVSMGRPFRYAINMYCLKHTGTIEFRMFRGTTDLSLIRNAFTAVERFLEFALSPFNKPGAHTRPCRFQDWYAVKKLEMPPMKWDRELWDGLPVSYTHLTLPTNREV